MQTAPEQASFIEHTADLITRRGWRTPALVALEAGRPLTFLGGQLLWVAQPVFSLIFPSLAVGKLAALLEDQNAVNTLITRLEKQES